MWEAVAERVTSATPDAVWRLWEDPRRWRDWNEDIASAELHGPFARGQTARVRLKRSLPLRFTITELEPQRLFTDEARLPGARLGHEHRLEQLAEGRVRIRNRLYVDGPLERLYAALAGRRMRRSVERMVERERALAESEG